MALPIWCFDTADLIFERRVGPGSTRHGRTTTMMRFRRLRTSEPLNISGRQRELPASPLTWVARIAIVRYIITLTITDPIMAMSATERKRLQIERERERSRRQIDLSYALPRPGFGAWLKEKFDGDALQHLDICYDGMNRLPPDFSTDSDPVSATGDFEFPMTEQGAPSHVGALGRAELEVDLLLEAARTLAIMINAYKRKVISDRLKQIETQELSDPETRPVRLREVIELTKAQERLARSVRAEIPQWQLRG